jgi:dolichol-phosphate mannosyltransferase
LLDVFFAGAIYTLYITKKMRISIIIPTYNEAENIGGVLEGIQQVTGQPSEHDWSVIVVDSNSPDGTARVVKEFQKDAKNMYLIEEPSKQGIARAYLVGIRYAKDTLASDAFIEFDGDGQHDPQALLLLADALASGADCVVGSRYISGGSIPAEWKLYRKMLSYGGSICARLVLDLPIRDATSGLKATSLQNHIAKHLPLSEGQLLSSSYAYKIQFLHAITINGGRIVEVPITFRMRDFDISKSSWKDITESLKVIGILRLRTLPQWRLLRVVGVGAIGFLIQTIFFEILGVYLKVVSPGIAVLIGAEFAILSNFFLNQKFSFGNRPTTSIKSKLIKFHIVSLASVVTQWACVSVAEYFVPTTSVAFQLFYVFGVALGFAMNYIGYAFWVW